MAHRPADRRAAGGRLRADNRREGNDPPSQLPIDALVDAHRSLVCGATWQSPKAWLTALARTPSGRFSTSSLAADASRSRSTQMEPSISRPRSAPLWNTPFTLDGLMLEVDGGIGVVA
jgi:hypothetical protein